MALLLEGVDEFANFGFGGFVVLDDGEVEGMLEDGLGVGGAGEREEGFGFEDFGHHPVVLFADAEIEVLDGFLMTAFADQGLSEGETEELVLRVLGYEGLEALCFHVGAFFAHEGHEDARIVFVDFCGRASGFVRWFSMKA